MILYASILVAVSFVISAVLTFVVKGWSLKTGFVAEPQVDRFSKRTVPMGGGIAIFGTLALIILGGALSVKFFAGAGMIAEVFTKFEIDASDFMGKIDQLIILMASAAILFVLGLVDDKKHLGPFLKLAVQFAAAFLAAGFADVRVEFFIHNTIITTAISAVWIVLLINVFNFLDNMDGASVGIAAIITGILFTAGVVSGQVFVSGLALVFMGTLGGFLAFNFPPARIFAGDCGSLVVGFFVATLSLKTTYYNVEHGGNYFAVFMPLIALSVPLYDFATVTFLRISQGKSPFVGDTQHFSHRLKKRGLSERQTVLTLYLATLCTGIGAAFLNQLSASGALAVFAQTVMILLIIAIMESTKKQS